MLKDDIYRQEETVKESSFKFKMNIFSSISSENELFTLEDNGNSEDDHYIFDENYVRILFFSLYTLVFCFCFFGNILIMFVIMLNRRLRSITNFFLANLALADFCVGIFCIYQNFFIYIIKSWSLGEFLCKMYLFIQTLSSTASILILVGICVERYFAIIYPIMSKRILTPKRLKIKMLIIWVVSMTYSSPRFIFGKTIMNVFSNGKGNETICIMNRQEYNSEVSDIFHFILFYCLPMLILSSLYTKISLCLWRSTKQVKKALDASNKSKKSNRNMDGNDRSQLTTAEHQHSGHNVLKARRGVIKMLMIVVFFFAICHLPFHLRKICLYWSSIYKASTDLSAILTPLTFLSTYLNSAVNPLLYAFLSNNFRREIRSMIRCFDSKKKKKYDIHLRLRGQQSSQYTSKTNNFTQTGSYDITSSQ
ncbi:trissin receptor isoform X2 [Coccinella septempunctata]|uniref:trissin receptor isoform X2 n=1 Tax=Coccinella septempunctata TaxID=41139 RepID=UPI001D06989F|nr:trissin receptor isoform X2 [Coccinella septempunctata]